ncbi:centrobin [Hyperolius riggenbachi]|uniref:centrobin n=1 Tax=Hyperolius riggenbachi TaxID=752182 RepID=UPI0035A2E830
MALSHAFSLQDSSLLSGIEPLPLSSPPSPHRSIPGSSSPPPALFTLFSPSMRRTSSSQVTTQLYASLRLSRELDEEDSEGAPNNISSGEQKPAMTSEVDELADEMSRRLQEGVEASSHKEASSYISQMESLRGHLKNMLTLGSTAPLHGDVDRPLEQHSDCTSTLLSARPDQNLSPPLSLTGLEGLFPRYSTLYHAAPSLPDLQLRDALEKETARRKHLERHIQNLQNEMLELQQRLSISLTADRRKDAMIQQLDQTLAVVVGGWKQQEQQREEAVRRLKQEKEEAEKASSKEQEALGQVQQELVEVLQSLEKEKQAADQRQIQLQRQVDEQGARLSQLQAELEAAEQTRTEESRELESLQYRMQEQQRTWEERERELQEECQRLQEEGRRELEEEKAVAQQEAQRSQQLQLALSSLQSEVLRLERDLQTAQRERDTLLMELNVEKARSESEKVRLESEHKMRLEEVITERLASLHEESAQHLCNVREQHRKQLLDLTSQHETELSNQLAQFKSELQERERRHREVIIDCELRLSRSEEHCQELSRSLRRLESERSEMLAQLQDVMKSHWSQALRVLSAKAPTEALSPFVLPQQTELSEQWTNKLAKEGGSGETRDQNTQGMPEVGLLSGCNNQLSESSSSLKAPDRILQKISFNNEDGGSHFSNASHPLEDSSKACQKSAGCMGLKESVNMDLINFSQLQNDHSQDLIYGNQFKESSPRYMLDGSRFRHSAKIGGKSSGQCLLGVSQTQDNIDQLSKVLKATESTNIRSVFNSSGHFESKDREKQIQQEQHMPSVASNPSRGYGDYQSVIGSSLETLHRELSGMNIFSSDQFKDIGNRSPPVTFKDHRNQNLLTHPQAMMDYHPYVIGHKSFLDSGRKQFHDNTGFSFTSGYSEPSILKDSTRSQAHVSNVQTVDQAMKESSHFKEFSSFLSHMGHLQTAVTIPQFSPISKDVVRSTNQEIRLHPGPQEKSSHTSYTMQDPEENFYPLQMEELSHSFSSHHGFFPLEPHPDGTMTGAVSTTLSQTSPEHPFQEDPTLNPVEMPSSRKTGGGGDIPNPLLQYYIRMLLDRTPGDPLNELEKDTSHVTPDLYELSQYLQSRGKLPSPRAVEKEARVPKPQTNPKKHQEGKAPEAVKKEVLSTQRRQNVPKPLKRVSARGGRSIWK